MAERTNPTIKLNGVPIARSYAIDFIEGADIEISIASTNGGAEITITSTGSSGSVSHTDLTNVTANQHHNQAHAVNGADHSGTLDDAQIPATIARDTEVSTAVSTHEAAVDPHTGYLKESNTIDFLVGTATADLAGEIVVGATPGGELGNTWASPTVDSSHSGSTHAATQAAAEATAAAANTADIATHAGLADPHTGYRLESADHTHASTGIQAGTIDHGVITGLADDDHPQYALDTDLTTHAGAVDPHTGYRLESADHTHASTGIQAGTIDHGVITGLSDDDHPQYALDTDLTTHAGAADPHTGYLKESNTIDFLVGTATAELAGEVVVGTTPGGELGNTWASPTVDASHSGSTHAATQAAAEATAAAALVTHAALPETNVGQLDIGSFTIPTAGSLRQATRLTLTTTERMTGAGTGRAALSDEALDPSVIRYRQSASTTIMPEEFLLEPNRVIFAGTVRRTMIGNGRSVLTDFLPTGRLVLAGRG